MGFFKGSKYVYLSVLTANLAGILSGISLTWSSPIIPKLENDDIGNNPFNRKITESEASWIGSLGALGGIFGPFIYAFLVEKFGRKKTIASLYIPYITSFLIAALAKDLYLFYLARILMGLGLGGVFAVVPIYIVEVASDVNRGLLSASTTGFIYAGMLTSYSIGPYFSIFTFNLILTAVCIVFLPIFWFVAPETPYYLTKSKEHEKAKMSLRYLRRKPSKILNLELMEINKHLDEMTEGTLQELFTIKGNRKALLYSIILTSLQQFTGVTVILFYNENIFDATGTKIPPEICAIIVGAIQLSFCYLTPLLSDHLGRKTLLYISVTGVGFSLVAIGAFFTFQDHCYDVSGVFWIPVTSLAVYMISYDFGMGALPWAMMSELLPLNIIGIASSIVTSIYWISGFILSKFFVDIAATIGMGNSFFLFAAFCFIMDLFVYFFLFETKGKSLREIQAVLNK